MNTIPTEILDAINSDDDEAFDELLIDEEHCFTVDHRAFDDEIAWQCENILKTGRLSSPMDGTDLFIAFGPKKIKVPLTMSSADRHITLLAINEALAPEFEVRMLYASVGNDSGTFVPLSTENWSFLEQKFPQVLARRFHKLTLHPNTFTEIVPVPGRAAPTRWWPFGKAK